MKKTRSGHRADRSRTPAPPRPDRGTRARRHIAGAAAVARAGAGALLDRLPGTVRATWVGANGATSALQTLPDSTLRWLAAGSVGIGAGLLLAGAPRVVVAAGVAPALAMGAAALARPSHPVELADVTDLTRRHRAAGSQGTIG
jgi:hypothetical protein